MPFGDPGRKAVGKNGNDFAADGADALRGVGEEGAGHLREPVGLDENIVVTEDDNGAAGFGDGAVAGVVEALAGFEQVARGGMGGGEFGDDGAGVVGGVVVEDENFEVVAGKLLGDEAGEGLAQEGGAIVGRDRDGDLGSGRGRGHAGGVCRLVIRIACKQAPTKGGADRLGKEKASRATVRTVRLRDGVQALAPGS